jgi:GNAT superfamily N-acetyltransferase
MSLRLAVVPFDDPVSQQLIDELQAEYVARYGGGDATPVEPGEFAPPNGTFIVVSDAGEPVACGGFRITEPGIAELKRMYVRAAHRRRGIARMLLARLEDEAREAGVRLLRLETGSRQPEALAMYTAMGYVDAEPFGHYACEPEARHYAKVLA